MARGWESKSVEMQIEDREQASVLAGKTAEDSAARRELDLLELSKKRLLTELEAVGDHGDHRFRSLKRRALAHVEAQIAALSEKAASTEADRATEPSR
jgi:hypothetical protein